MFFKEHGLLIKKQTNILLRTKLPSVSVTLLLFSYGFLLFITTSNIHAFENYRYTSSLITLRNPFLPVFFPENRSLGLTLAVKNIWSLQHEKFIIDGEEVEILIHKHYPFKKKHSAGIFLSVKNQSGGILDRAITFFHRSFGITQQHRENFPENKIQISYEYLGEFYQFYDYYPFIKNLRRSFPRHYPRKSYDPPKFLPLPVIAAGNTSYIQFDSVYLPLERVSRDNHNLTSLDNPEIYYGYTFSGSSGQSFYLGVSVKIPVFNTFDYFHAAGWDGSVFVSLRSELVSWVFLWGISYNYYEYRKHDLLELPKFQWSFRLHALYKATPYSYFSEYVFVSKPVKNLGRLSEDIHVISLGLKIPAGSSFITTGIAENVYKYATAPDVGFFFSLHHFLSSPQ